MKLLIRILLYVFIILIANVKLVGAAITLVKIQQTTSISSNTKTPKSFSEISKNHLAICCQNGNDLVVYRNWGTCIEADAAKTVPQYTKSSLKLGQEMHKAYHAGKVGKEFRLPSGKRIDFLDINNRTIYELKPFNPRAMQQGQKQLNMYMQELQTMPRFKGIQWKTVLDTY